MPDYKEIYEKRDFYREKRLQMMDNISRMEIENKLNMPALDTKSKENEGKTQFEIDSEIAGFYETQEIDFVKANSEIFSLLDNGSLNYATKTF